nr:hypothetical protein [Morchella crassipes]
MGKGGGDKGGGVSQEAIQQRELHLVVWGTKLGSTVGYFGRFTKQIRSMIELAPYQLSVIVGLLLSDGWLGLAHNRKCSVIISPVCSSSWVPFICIYILSHYCSNYLSFYI